MQRLFQPTLPPKGATRLDCLHAGPGADFNPRSHRRERQYVVSRPGCFTYFNPRSHRRERPVILDNRVSLRNISTHAPTEGSDLGLHRRIKPVESFQPTLPPKGATACTSSAMAKLQLFQPTLPPKGATPAKDVLTFFRGIFQPTLPPKGATRRRMS